MMTLKLFYQHVKIFRLKKWLLTQIRTTQNNRLFLYEMLLSCLLLAHDETRMSAAISETPSMSEFAIGLNRICEMPCYKLW